MRRMMFVAAVLIAALSASQVEARGPRGMARFFGFHMGQGIHAKNGCYNCGAAYYYYQQSPHYILDTQSIKNY